MASIPGTNIAAPVVPFTDQDDYATHDAKYGLGGWREVATMAERDAIPTKRLRNGMVVVVQADNSAWQLVSGSWVSFSAGGGGLTLAQARKAAFLAE